MIFLSVGTQFGFDRLVKAVDECLGNRSIEAEIFAQIGPGAYVPKHMPSVSSLDRDAFELQARSCEALISHAGMGSITLALRMKKPLLVVPRRKKYGEVVNDHQVGTARRFSEEGHIIVAYDTHDLAEQIRLLKEFVPKAREPNRQGVVDRITEQLRHSKPWPR